MPAPDPGAVLAIIAHCRAGALDQGWRLFNSAGLNLVDDDPAVASLKGRLLKDDALRSSGARRTQLFAESAAAYEASATIRAASYSWINAATLAELAGQPDRAKSLAAQVLDLIQRHPEEPETPYYHAATRAEALLLLDRENEARATFAEAIAVAPRAWEDHASTLRQFSLVLQAQGRDSAWLDAHRPPRSLHFGGHMSFDPKVVRREHLDEKIAAVLEEENIGFAFGALAAGADIIIAEALLARGAELHAILPGGAEAFAAVSVDPFGGGWRRRFDAVLAEADTVRPVRPLRAPPNDATIGLADEVAMGAALMNGRRLESSAVQLLVLDCAQEANGTSGRSRDVWQAGGWRQRILTAPRETRPEPLGEEAEGPSPLAVLAVGMADCGIEDALAALQEQVGHLPAPALPPYLAEDRLILAYRGPGEAAEAAIRLLQAGSDTLPLRIGGQYGPAPSFRDPFSGSVRLAAAAASAAAGALASAPRGTAFVTDDFAAALAAAGPRRPASEYIGELDAPDGGPPVGLYALKSYDQLFQPLGGDDGQ
ncbi:MAG TPA: hypothetical protein VF574_18080 [Allosphingosinicella sp.]|jgi:tetratricopeptide (TPR) repeat protein